MLFEGLKCGGQLGDLSLCNINVDRIIKASQLYRLALTIMMGPSSAAF